MTYHFSHVSTKAAMFLKEILGACANSGEHVVAAVCDMGTNNVKILKLLCVSEMEPFFKF